MCFPVSLVSGQLVGGCAGEAEAGGVQRATESRQLHQEEVGKREYIPTADGSYSVSGDFLGAPPVCPAFSASLWANL